MFVDFSQKEQGCLESAWRVLLIDVKVENYSNVIFVSKNSFLEPYAHPSLIGNR